MLYVTWILLFLPSPHVQRIWHGYRCGKGIRHLYPSWTLKLKKNSIAYRQFFDFNSLPTESNPWSTQAVSHHLSPNWDYPLPFEKQTSQEEDSNSPLSSTNLAMKRQNLERNEPLHTSTPFHQHQPNLSSTVSSMLKVFAPLRHNLFQRIFYSSCHQIQLMLFQFNLPPDWSYISSATSVTS